MESKMKQKTKRNQIKIDNWNQVQIQSANQKTWIAIKSNENERAANMFIAFFKFFA